LALKPDILEKAIIKDINSGKKPLCVVATIGTTGTMAIDPLSKIAGITQKYGIWLHVDAAYAGSAMVLPEYRWMIEGLEHADSYVFNPHKWLFTNFDLSAYYVKDKDVLIRTFSIMPEYLKTQVDQKVNNYRDWGIQLGRRFRALKLWFVLRNFGVEELKNRIKKHIEMVQELASDIKKDPDFELIVENPLNMLCFRFRPGNIGDEPTLNTINEKILQKINATEETFLTHTRIRGTYVIRLVAGQTYLEKEHLQEVWQLIRKTCYDILKNE
jgi:aromatic-L-amino-acid decarboxylase